VRRRRRTGAAPGADRAAQLAAAVGASVQEAAALLGQLAGQPVDGDDVVAAAGALAARSDDPDAARGRLLQLLIDVEQRSLEEMAAVLGLSVTDASALLRAARRSSGAPGLVGRCRGWALVADRVELTTAEQRARDGHLLVCRGCRDRLAMLERSRLELVSRTAGVTALVGGGAAAGLSGGAAATAGGGMLAAGKIAVIGVLGAAVLAAGGMTAAVQHANAPAATVRGEVLTPAHSEPDCGTSCGESTPLPGASAGAERPVPQPSPSSSGAVGGAAELPVMPSLPALPTLPVPPLPTLPVPPLPALPVPSLPAAPVAAVPSLPAVPSVTAVPSLPAVPPVPAVTPVPTLPGVRLLR
jgi:hypothetical protein